MQSQLQYLHKSDWSFLIYFSNTLTEVLEQSPVSTGMNSVRALPKVAYLQHKSYRVRQNKEGTFVRKYIHYKKKFGNFRGEIT